MFKQKLFLSLLVLLLLSCNKEKTHKVRFEVVFLEDCVSCMADFVDVLCTPSYSDQEPEIHASHIVVDYRWYYEYWALKDGDKVVFSVLPTGDEYRFRLNIYIDDVLVSYRESYGENGLTTIDQWGLNSGNYNTSTIEFIYNE